MDRKQELMESLVERYRDEIKGQHFGVKDGQLVHKGYQIDFCESPIERLMFVALNHVNFTRAERALNIEVQKKIEANRKNYRVDFVISTFEMVTFNHKLWDKHAKVVVECDGHDFHEKTKEQAQRDKSRDRDLINEGYIVLRFTGSEVYKNPIECATQVRRTLEGLLAKEEFKPI